MIQVRASAPGDEEALRAISDQALGFLRRFYRPKAAGFANRSRLSASLSRLVAMVDGRVVGTAEWHIEGRTLRVLGVGVREEFRRAGVARALLDHTAALAADRGCGSVRLATIRETGNVPIFEKLGFTIVSEFPSELCESPIGEPVVEVELERTVAPTRS